MYINLYSDDPSVNQEFLFNYFDINISPELLRVDGVGDLDILGTRSYAMRVWLHPDKMVAYGLSTDDVSDALEDQNIEVSPGKLGESGGICPQGEGVCLEISRPLHHCRRVWEYHHQK